MRTLLILFFLAICLQSSLSGIAQAVSLEVHDEPLGSVFQMVQRQTAYRFVYSSEQLTAAKKVTLSLKNAPITVLLEAIFKGQPVGYNLRGEIIVVTQRTTPADTTSMPGPVITGRVIDEQGNGLPAVSIVLKGKSAIAITDGKGNFVLKDIGPSAVLVFSSIGYESSQVSVNGQTHITIQLIHIANTLDETVVKGYYSTTRRLNTGNTSTVTAAEIAQQPISNPLGALEGRVAGLIVNQSSGIPGSSYKIQVRGQNSLSQGSDPYIVIDGVPFTAGNSNISQVAGAFSFKGNGLSPFNNINPNDIESIEVLKDADATAIYGSKGANGVILITTKKGKAGQTKTSLTVYHGAGHVTRTGDMLNTRQYVQMRREAYANDGIIPTPSGANDILVWDTTRYTDWKKVLIGGTSHTTDAQGTVSGGSANTQFMINGGYHNETSVFPGAISDDRGSLHFNLAHHSDDQRFLISLTGNYSVEQNNNIVTDLASYLYTIPNTPALYDDNGHLAFSKDGYAFDNPFASLLKKYTAKIDNFLANLQLRYQFGHGFSFKTSTGINTMNIHEISTNPIASQNPAYNPTGYSQFGDKQLKTFIAEPQLDYQLNTTNSNLNVLLGGSWQQSLSSGSYIFANGYKNDDLLHSLGGASAVYPTTTYSRYRYAAAFIRAGYTLKNKYLLNLTARRDGSSRFGPGRRFANFGAVGAGWIFSSEAFAKTFKFISFGKLRGSYGTAGNDAIGDYKYLSTYGSAAAPYQGTAGLVPTGLFNPDYNWEINKKLELGLELGLFKDRFLFNIAWFRNRSSNQLVSYALPAQTGFTSVTENFPAVVQNTGVELELTASLIKTPAFKWKSTFLISIPKNKLVSYPGIETSSYRDTYVVGKSLHIGNGFMVTGVDPATGIYTFLSGKGIATNAPVYPDDYVKAIVNLDPVYTGSLGNSFTCKGLELVVFFEFRKQMGYSYRQDASQTPGIYYNQPTLVLDRWQHPGDNSNVQKYTANFGGAAYNASSKIASYGGSNQYTDASFARLKTVSLSYNLKTAKLTGNRFQDTRLFLQAQNLLTFTGYKGSDPESQSFYHLPPIKTIVAGIQLTF